jgi:hypothetical protein
LGRRFFLRAGPLRVLKGQVAPDPQDIVCTIDEELRIGSERWFHVRCSAELADDGPFSWRSGCYRHDGAGVWRVPHCPSGADDPPMHDRRQRMVLPTARPRPEIHSRFLELSQGVLVASELQVGVQRFATACYVESNSGATVRCFDGEVGLRWSAQRWGDLPSAYAERGVLTVHTDLDGTVEASAPHLQFEDPASAACETATECREFGLCRYQEGACIATRDAHCRRAAVCERAGLCRARGGVCDVGEDADCAASRSCREKGACVRGEGRCVVPPPAATTP